MTIEIYDFIILYGTQTGQSKAIAESIAERAEQQHELKTKISCLSLFEKNFSLEEEKVAVFIISSTGDGDNPESTLKFFRKLNRKTLPTDHLTKLKFALLGLGDTNYNNFCACPKRLEKRLLDLGAVPFYSSRFCDDAVGTELTAEPWIEGLFEALKAILGKKPMDVCSKKSVEIDESFKTLKLSSDSHVENRNDYLSENFVCSLVSKNVEECKCIWSKPSVRYSFELSEIAELKVPIVAQPFLTVTFHEDDAPKEIVSSIQNGAEFPSQHSKIMAASVVSRQQLTKVGAKKTKYAIFLEIPGAEELNCMPGDAFYFICPNNVEEVEWLLQRLKLRHVADKRCSTVVLPDTTKKNASVPAYIPSDSTLRSIFTTCVDIRRPISRILLRILTDYCTNDNDKRRLTELSSNQGMNEFSDYVRVNGLSLLDMLHAFPSCFPPVERLLEQVEKLNLRIQENDLNQFFKHYLLLKVSNFSVFEKKHLPRLQPRPLSIASSTLNGQKLFRFVYSLVDIPAGQGRFYSRYGICTGFLTKIPYNEQIMAFMKKPTHFRLTPEIYMHPMILVGPGTGVAPFVGFLENLRNSSSNELPTEIWLFFGCRDEAVDFIFQKELESFKKDKVLSELLVCFSQTCISDNDDQRPRYVQHNIRKHGAKLASLLKQSEARIFVCGDAKHMANDVNQAFVDILAEYDGKPKQECVEHIKLMQSQFRYVQDVWT